MHRIFLFLVGVFVSGCSSVSVVGQKNYPVPSLPDIVYVEPFVFRGSEFRVNRSENALESFQSSFQSELQSGIIRRLFKAGIRGVKSEDGQFFAGEGDWVIKGEILQVVEGSRAVRSSIGLGLGATKVRLYIRVYSISNGRPDRLLMSFWVEGGSNAEPGGAYYPPWSFPRALHVAMTSGVSFDRDRAARQVVSTLLERMEQLGGYSGVYSSPKRPLWYWWERE
jgi:hypothetical protein